MSVDRNFPTWGHMSINHSKLWKFENDINSSQHQKYHFFNQNKQMFIKWNKWSLLWGVGNVFFSTLGTKNSIKIDWKTPSVGLNFDCHPRQNNQNKHKILKALLKGHLIFLLSSKLTTFQHYKTNIQLLKLKYLPHSP